MSFAVAPGAYDRFMGRYSVQLAPQLSDFAGVHSGQRVVDVGCGPGALTQELVARLGPDAGDTSCGFIALLLTFGHTARGAGKPARGGAPPERARACKRRVFRVGDDGAGRVPRGSPPGAPFTLPFPERSPPSRVLSKWGARLRPAIPRRDSLSRGKW